MLAWISAGDFLCDQNRLNFRIKMFLRTKNKIYRSEANVTYRFIHNLQQNKLGFYAAAHRWICLVLGFTSFVVGVVVIMGLVMFQLQQLRTTNHHHHRRHRNRHHHHHLHHHHHHQIVNLKWCINIYLHHFIIIIMSSSSSKSKEWTYAIPSLIYKWW